MDTFYPSRLYGFFLSLCLQNEYNFLKNIWRLQKLQKEIKE
jgi:hypothetical protein